MDIEIPHYPTEFDHQNFPMQIKNLNRKTQLHSLTIFFPSVDELSITGVRLNNIIIFFADTYQIRGYLVLLFDIQTYDCFGIIRGHWSSLSNLEKNSVWKDQNLFQWLTAIAPNNIQLNTLMKQKKMIIQFLFLDLQHDIFETRKEENQSIWYLNQKRNPHTSLRLVPLSKLRKWTLLLVRRT